MTDTLRRVRAEVARADRRIGGFATAHKRYAPRSWYRVHPWGYYQDRFAAYERPRRIRLHRRPVNPHAVADALRTAAWGSHVCRPFHVATIGPTGAGKTPAGASVYELSPDGRRLLLVRQP